MRTSRLAALAAFIALAGACTTAPPTLPGVIVPAYVFPLGASQNDVLAMLGTPDKGPSFDRYSNLTELVYGFPFPAVRTETRFPDGTVRVETVDRIHLFFDRKNRLERMAYRTNRYYPSITELPVQRITVLPRRIDPDGRMHPVTAPDGSPASKQPPVTRAMEGVFAPD